MSAAAEAALERELKRKQYQRDYYRKLKNSAAKGSNVEEYKELLETKETLIHELESFNEQYKTDNARLKALIAEEKTKFEQLRAQAVKLKGERDRGKLELEQMGKEYKLAVILMGALSEQFPESFKQVIDYLRSLDSSDPDLVNYLSL